ncbi:MAG: hypothetical protein ACE5IH_05565, partial [Thermodesulfobacteriota bacterium]
LNGRSNSEGIVDFVLEEERKGMYLGVETAYRGTTYSTPFQPVEDKGEYRFTLPVYELSDREDLVSIKERTVFIKSIEGGTIAISETITISNTGNKTYVGRFNDEEDLHQVVRIGMPGGYERPTIDGVDLKDIIPRGDGLVINERVKPGEKDIFLSYKLRTDIGFFEFHFPVTTPYERFRLLLSPDIDWKVKTIRLKKKGNVKMGGVDYLQWEGGDLKKGAIVIVRLKSPEKGGVIGINELSILGGLILGLAVAGIYLKKVRRPSDIAEQKEYLIDIVENLNEQTKDLETTKKLYAPYRETLLKRIQEIDSILGTKIK